MQSSPWYNHAEIYNIYQSKWYKQAAKTDNVTKELLIEWGVPEIEIDALLEDFSESIDAFEAWKLRIKTAYKKLNQTERIKIGHDAKIFLHTAKSAGGCFLLCHNSRVTT